MVHVDTKRVGDTWYCYGTIEGYDHSFESDSFVYSKAQMLMLLNSKGINPDTEVKWGEIEVFEKSTKRNLYPNIWSLPLILDHLN